MRIFYVIWVLLLSMQLKSAENKKDLKFYKPKQKVASTQEANQFKEECLKQNIPSSCFDYGVHLAQTLNQESESLIYYDKSCKLEFEAACFNKGFILIKEIKTRTEGLENLQKICDSKEKTNLDPEKNEMIKFSCEFIPIIKNNMTKNYSEFVSQLPSKLKYSSANQDTSTASNDSSLKDEMNASLDRRLLELKKSNQLIFKYEMKLQKEFNSSIAKYCDFYKSKCEGTVCSLCINNCYSSFYRYRKEQSDKINTSSLQLIQSSNLHTNVKKYFTEFAKGICSMPEDIWKNAKKPKKCLEDILGDINIEVISSFYFKLETEGDVCAQLE